MFLYSYYIHNQVFFYIHNVEIRAAIQFLGLTIQKIFHLSNKEALSRYLL